MSWLAFLICSWSVPASAANFEVTGDVAAQGYEVASPWGDVVVGRRRLTTTLGLAGYNLQGDAEPLGPDYSLRLRMRVDSDFGIAGAEEQYNARDARRFVPGLDHAPVDLMIGFVEGRRLGGGWFGFRLGRQYVTDVLGWWSFDGGMVRLTTPFFVAAEVYGGMEQRGGLPLSSERYAAQGVWRGSRSEIGPDGRNYPSFQDASPAPAFGFALETTGPNWIHGRFAYRRVYSTGPVLTGQFPTPGTTEFEEVEGLRLSTEKFGYGATAFLSEIGALRAGFAYDVYNDLINKAYGGLEFYPITNRLVLGADIDFFVPTFDADSIWNWFTHNPVTTLLGRASVRPLAGLDVSGSAGVRLWVAEGDPEGWALAECTAAGGGQAAIDTCLAMGTDPSAGSDGTFAREEDNRDATIAPDLLANLGAGYRWSNGNVGLSGVLQNGFGDVDSHRGRMVGGVLTARQALDGGTLWVGGRLSTTNWEDPLRPARDATSFGYVVAPEYWPAGFARMRVQWEHDMNRLVGQRFRVLGLVSLRVAP
ncbi:MAG: hypothetical protein DRI90_25615 [Deltaproteobacteria bacterium]|nr:MAG: hypothetical protein DRI90_25615 [Deltaproteobacteria bacterium]